MLGRVKRGKQRGQGTMKLGTAWNRGDPFAPMTIQFHLYICVYICNNYRDIFTWRERERDLAYYWYIYKLYNSSTTSYYRFLLFFVQREFFYNICFLEIRLGELT